MIDRTLWKAVVHVSIGSTVRRVPPLKSKRFDSKHEYRCSEIRELLAISADLNQVGRRKRRLAEL